MKTYKMTEDEAKSFDTEAGWLAVRREARALALKHDEMVEVETPEGDVVDTVYPSSITP